MEWQDPKECILFQTMKFANEEYEEEEKIRQEILRISSTLSKEDQIQLNYIMASGNPCRDVVLVENSDAFQTWLQERCYKFITPNQKTTKDVWFELEMFKMSVGACTPILSDFQREVKRFNFWDHKVMHYVKWFPSIPTICEYIKECSAKFPAVGFYRLSCFLVDPSVSRSSNMFLSRLDPRYVKNVSTKGWKMLANENLNYELHYCGEYEPFTYAHRGNSSKIWFFIHLVAEKTQTADYSCPPTEPTVLQTEPTKVRLPLPKRKFIENVFQ